MIVSIDGPAGSGKSTVARALAERLGFHYLDTGAMYRAVALSAIRAGASFDDHDRLESVASSVQIEFEHEGDSPLPTRVLLDGEDVSAAIRTPEIDAAVSLVARIPAVRSAMVAQQRRTASSAGLVAEGRDIGTVVFPDATLKVFLTASEEERGRRRHLELMQRGEVVQEQAVREGIADRDQADSNRATSPLKPAEDSILVDTTGLSVEEVIESIARLVEDRS